MACNYVLCFFHCHAHDCCRKSFLSCEWDLLLLFLLFIFLLNGVHVCISLFFSSFLNFFFFLWYFFVLFFVCFTILL